MTATKLRSPLVNWMAPPAEKMLQIQLGSSGQQKTSKGYEKVLAHHMLEAHQHPLAPQ